MQTRSQTQCQVATVATASKETKHPKGWTTKAHYMFIGGQCGQSCQCCRAQMFISGMDPDAKFGACTICISNVSK
jgi:hypothetical protein